MRPQPRALFPTFLLPSMPFRRRKASTDSTASSSSSTSSPPLTPGADATGFPDILTASSRPPAPWSGGPSAPSDPSAIFLGRHVSYLRCARCAVDLCLASAIVSRGFTGRWGRAYLVSAAGCLSDPNATPDGPLPAALPNTTVHRPVPRQLVTGAHTVSDVSCAFCGSVLGWKYVAADEESQRYKVGKFILETKRVNVTADWEQEGGLQGPDALAQGARGPGALGQGYEDDEFDSQDEDECEDLFAGTWTAGAAASRRAARRFGREGV